MEIVDIDGVFHAAREIQIDNSGSEIEGVDAVFSSPVSASMEITRAMDVPSSVDVIHITMDDTLCTLTDAFVSGSDVTLAETYGDLSLIANELSVRPLTNRKV